MTFDALTRRCSSILPRLASNTCSLPASPTPLFALHQHGWIDLRLRLCLCPSFSSHLLNLLRRCPCRPATFIFRRRCCPLPHEASTRLLSLDSYARCVRYGWNLRRACGPQSPRRLPWRRHPTDSIHAQREVFRPPRHPARLRSFAAGRSPSQRGSA